MEEQKKWEALTPGIPDSMFVRGQVPMTKEEIRALTISKLRLREDSIVYDIGAGTGSITVEAALMARKGHVYAVERVAEGVRLILENAAAFGAANVTVIEEEAPAGLEGFPEADRIIIGGSGGHLGEILKAADSKLKAGGRMVINAVTMETLANAVKNLEAMGRYELDIVSLAVTRLEKIGRSHMFKALSPVYIISAEKKEAANER